jgi:MFS family permease
MAFGRSYALLPAVGALLLGGGAATVGFLVASGAVGVILSGLISGRVGTVRRHGRAIALAMIAMSLGIAIFGLLVLVLGTMPHTVRDDRVNLPALIALCAVLMVIGAADNVAGIFRTTMMQSATPDEMRGRLQGLFTLVLTAGPRLGDVYAGFLAAALALWWPPLLGAALILTVVAICYRTRESFRHYDALDPIP